MRMRLAASVNGNPALRNCLWVAHHQRLDDQEHEHKPTRPKARRTDAKF